MQQLQERKKKILKKVGSFLNSLKKLLRLQKNIVEDTGGYTKPFLRKELYKKIKEGTKGGKAGEWTTKKYQLLIKEYKAQGGGYINE